LSRCHAGVSKRQRVSRVACLREKNSMNGMRATSPASPRDLHINRQWRDAEPDWAARDGAAGRLSAVIYGGVMLPD